MTTPLRLHLLPLALGLVVFGTAVPLELQATQPWTYSASPRDVAVNVLLYLPLGLCLWRRPLALSLALGALLSLAIETLQMRYAGRHPAPARPARSAVSFERRPAGRRPQAGAETTPRRRTG